MGREEEEGGGKVNRLISIASKKTTLCKEKIKGNNFCGRVTGSYMDLWDFIWN